MDEHADRTPHQPARPSVRARRRRDPAAHDAPADVEPLRLFRTVAHNPAVLERFRTIGAYILNFGRVEPVDREVLLHRTCARCGCEYEWGVHAVAFGRPLGLSEEQLRATVLERPRRPYGRTASACWYCSRTSCTTPRRCPSRSGTRLSDNWDDAQLIELIATAGFYHLVSFTANAARVEPEPYAARFPTRSARQPERIAFPPCVASCSGLLVVLVVALAVNTVVTNRETEAAQADVGRIDRPAGRRPPGA